MKSRGWREHNLIVALKIFGGYLFFVKVALKNPKVWVHNCVLRLRANGRNNSQHCCANNVGSCCVRVGSGVQTDALTPNKFGTCSASWEEYNPQVFVIHT